MIIFLFIKSLIQVEFVFYQLCNNINAKKKQIISNVMWILTAKQYYIRLRQQLFWALLGKEKEIKQRERKLVLSSQE